MAKSTLLGLGVDEEIITFLEESAGRRWDYGLPLIWVCHWAGIFLVESFENRLLVRWEKD